MGYPPHLVVRKKKGAFRAGYARDMPLHDGWRHVKSFGFWYTSQMKFRPFKAALAEAKLYAKKRNEKAK